MIAVPQHAESPTRPELSALLRAARENPGDVTGRLVLADWLEEYGDEADYARAELVRLQCRSHPELERPSGPPVVPALLGEGGTAPQLRRQDRLLSHGAAWLGALGGSSLTGRFRRGLVSLEVDAGQAPRLLSHNLDRPEAWAWVEGVELHGVSGRGLGQLANCRRLASVTSLAIVGELGRAEMRALIRADWFGGLRELLLTRSLISDDALALLAEAAPALAHLSLFRSGVTRRGVERLLRSPLLDGLTTLDLRYDRLGDAVVETLADHARPDGLKRLLLAGNGISARGCRALIRRASGGLTCLDLSRNPLGIEGAQALAGAASLARLTRLDVGQCQLTEQGARLLLCSPYLRQLEQLCLNQNEIDHVCFLPPHSPSRLHLLDLSGNPFGEAALAQLALSAAPGRLTSLSLAECGVTPAALAELARSEWLMRLAELDLGGNPLGAEGATVLGGCAGRLEALGLSGCSLDDVAVARLTGPGSLGRLTCLHLADNLIGPDGAEALAAGGLAGLVALDLDGSPVGDEGAVRLVESKGLPGLGLLSLRDCDLTDAGVLALAHSPGLARLSRLALAGPDLGGAAARALLDSPHAGSLRVLCLRGLIRDPGLRRALKLRFGCEPTCWPSSG